MHVVPCAERQRMDFDRAFFARLHLAHGFRRSSQIKLSRREEK